MVGANDLNIYTLALRWPVSSVHHCTLGAYTGLPSSYTVSIYGVEE